ncbi:MULTISPECIES: response regulator transcription factor [unclassified Clostridium]|uniref:response regulator transcription factor n=1 Tax=unclassified Clostridium TaxID=2614128 RepID=UPI001C8CA300|nr:MULTISPECIES: response regulator transcription factor [unclassified Clostridium]MBX9138542.1 response regulator transcription factor [Clostridium sp. K12(2020)]MBX9144923.1 response regulator transcription factor [Clostridium sp. K13]MDU2292137.1 response regulator transcription factor [Clostridium celatum]MDU4326159.1 response regulator transcription factor [Clostridium celatum]
MEKIIIVEDNKDLKNELIDFLSRYGYEAYGPDKFDNIMETLLKDNADLILLDINLPYYDGYYICREIRKVKNTPIIIVTSRNSDMDEIMSMNLGADDFVTKPYNTQVLLARIASLLRRSSGGKYQEILEHKGLKLNVTTGVMEFNNSTVDLTKNEIKILSCLIKNKGVIVSRDELMDYLWNSDMFVDENTLSVNIARLRKKLDSIGFKDAIETKRGIGYSLL